MGALHHSLPIFICWILSILCLLKIWNFKLSWFKSCLSYACNSNIYLRIAFLLIPQGLFVGICQFWSVVSCVCIRSWAIVPCVLVRGTYWFCMWGCCICKWVCRFNGKFCNGAWTFLNFVVWKLYGFGLI